MADKIVIAGAGHAAGQAIATLRQRKFDGQIVLVGEEQHLPYQRPPLSKKYLSGELPVERLYVKPASFYDDPKIELRLGTTIGGLDRGAKRLQVGAGDSSISYDKLILALGSRARRLEITGDDLPGVHYLRSIADVDAIRHDLETSKHVVIIGAGYIGLEVAAVIRTLGLNVTVVEMAPRVMSRVVSPEISDFYQIEHTDHGVKLRLSTGIAALRGNGRISVVETSDGERLPADLVIVGVGIQPNIELAEDAGLTIDNGIVVDDRCQTNDADIFAIGDCTSHPNSIYDRKLRLESVHNALEQAKTAANNLSGIATHYSDLPWFWSDQYDLKLQIAGLSEGYDDLVIRGNPAERAFSCLYLKDGCLIAADAINAPRDFIQSKALIANHSKVERAELGNTDLQLKDLSG